VWADTAEWGVTELMDAGGDPDDAVAEWPVRAHATLRPQVRVPLSRPPFQGEARVLRGCCTAMTKLRIVILRFGTARQ
jgi:hypothetical protein